MWKLKIAEGGSPWLRTLNNHVGRQVWEFDPKLGSPEDLLEIENARQNFHNNRFTQQHSADLLMRFQFAKENPMNEVLSKVKVKDIEDVTEETVTTTLRRALNFHSTLQSHDGHWPGDYGGPMFLMPGLIIVLSITGALNAVLTEEHRKEMCRYLYNHQNKNAASFLLDPSSRSFSQHRPERSIYHNFNTLGIWLQVVKNISKVFPKDNEAPPGGVDDMTKLSYLHEPGVLHNLAIRYELNEIYTYTGNILIAINPFQRLPHLYDTHMMQQYKGAAFGELSPHVFAVADVAYSLIQFLKHFGNAKTVRNNDSSRFGKFVEIQFDKGRISGAAIRTYLLERSRVCQVSDPERNYHCFYLLCAAPAEEKEKYKLGSPGSFHYLNQSKCYVLDGVDDAEEYLATRRAMDIVGISEEEQEAIFMVVAAVLHLGNVEFAEGEEIDSSVLKDEKSRFHLNTTAELLKCDVKSLEDALIQRVMVTPGQD